MNWSSEENIRITYRLLNVKGYGCAQTNKLLWHISPSVSSSAQLEAAIKASLKPEGKAMFENDYILNHSNLNVCYLSVMDDELYPSQLIDALHQNTPTVLSYIGNIDLLQKKSAGICGSRNVSEKGLWITKDCAAQLASNDICVVSGYASGVDLAAHKTALENGGTTIIVLPEGISTFSIRNELKEIWDWNRILVVSEFLPQDKWMVSRAMKRNQTIIGLSDIMLIIEAGETGGSLDAGLKAILMGKDLFVPCYTEIPESAVGNTQLLKKGARPLMLSRSTMRTGMDAVMVAVDRSKHREYAQTEMVF